ncbi:hypothetical protein EV401DRAFT_1976326, partial [Pisolithus croceorrhizus]
MFSSPLVAVVLYVVHSTLLLLCDSVGWVVEETCAIPPLGHFTMVTMYYTPTNVALCERCLFLFAPIQPLCKEA